MAVLEASKWIDAGFANKLKMAETIAAKSLCEHGRSDQSKRILGRYQNGLGKTLMTRNHTKFFNDGKVNFHICRTVRGSRPAQALGLLKDHLTTWLSPNRSKS